MNNYSVDYFIKKFKAIPSSKWCLYSLENGGKHCALGHCGMIAPSIATPDSAALIELFHKHSISVITTNDIQTGEFNQRTPKSRILAALNFIKKKSTK